MIKLTKKESPFENLYWVCLALQSEKEASRKALSRVNVELDPLDDKIIFTATDGRRLHRFTADIGAYFEGVKPGLYQLAKKTKTEIVLVEDNDEDLIYPDAEKVIPDFTERNWVPLICGTLSAIVSRSYARALRLLSNKKYSYDIGYFKDFINTPPANSPEMSVYETQYYAMLLSRTENSLGVLCCIEDTDIQDED